MDQESNILGGIFSPFFSINRHVNTHDTYSYNPEITIHQNMTQNYNTNFHANFSKTHILSMSGSNNMGYMLNDAIFNMTSIFHRPIFLQLHHHPLLLSSILIFAVLFCLVVISLFIYNRHQKRIRQRFRSSRLSSNVPKTSSSAMNINRTAVRSTISKAIQQKKMDASCNDPLSSKPRAAEKLLDIERIEVKNEKEDDHSGQVLLTDNNSARSDKYQPFKKRWSIKFHRRDSLGPLYDEPPIHSISQWAHDEILKHMKI